MFKISGFKVKTEANMDRTCWACNQSLSFNEAYSTNPRISKDRFKELWDSHNLHFFCCKCYDYEVKKVKLEQERKRLRDNPKKMKN